MGAGGHQVPAAMPNVPAAAWKRRVVAINTISRGVIRACCNGKLYLKSILVTLGILLLLTFPVAGIWIVPFLLVAG